MRRILVLLSIALPMLVQAQVYNLAGFGVVPANYSGLTPIGSSRFAVVSDKETHPGFYVWQIEQDPMTGAVTRVTSEGFRADNTPLNRDAEGIAYCSSRGTVYISGEADQRIVEHRLDGSLTGRELAIPEGFGTGDIQPNRGFEALGYDTLRHVFWTTTESPRRGDREGMLHLLQFDDQGRCIGQHDYMLDAPQSRNPGRDHYHGVVAITPLPDGTLALLEREARIAPRYNGSRCWCKVYLWNPLTGEKSLLEEWNTKFSLTNTRMANYEGMCLGQVLTDGTQTLLLVSDSQAGFGKGKWHLKDYLKVIEIRS